MSWIAQLLSPQPLPTPLLQRWTGLFPRQPPPPALPDQVEGFVIDRNLSLGNLMGTIADFYRRLGPEFKDMKFKPTYNPYTEPSMEFHCYHEGLGKWVEVGNSGVFRPEMLRPMGFDEDVQVVCQSPPMPIPAHANPCSCPCPPPRPSFSSHAHPPNAHPPRLTPTSPTPILLPPPSRPSPPHAHSRTHFHPLPKCPRAHALSL